MMRRILWFGVLCPLWLGACSAPGRGVATDAGSSRTTVEYGATSAAPRVGQREDQVLDVAQVWAGHPVGFALLTHGARQYVAFYDAQRQMTVAARNVHEPTWDFVKLPSHVVWDSHNYITMAIDDSGRVHLAGNMHVGPLVYFRMTRPDDIHSFTQLPAMVGRQETRCTYPVFMRGANHELIFTYRFGQSGNGDQYFNIYDEKTRTWRRLLDTALTAGQGRMNAYFSHMVRGPDGKFHVVWVWRDTYLAQTNHDLSYARSTDLVHWETSDGHPLHTPITLATGEIVDPVPPNGGIINGGCAVGFDGQGRVIISYMKYDAAGMSQLYVARREARGWQSHQISHWSYRWDFHGGGSLGREIGVSPAAALPDGRLVLPYSHVVYGHETFLIDGGSLNGLGLYHPPAASRSASTAAGPHVEADLAKVQSTFPGMQVNWGADLGASTEPGISYRLRWETLGPNRDLPRAVEVPPSMLVVVRQEGLR